MPKISQRQLATATSIAHRVLEDSPAGMSLKKVIVSGGETSLLDIVTKSMGVTYAARAGITNLTRAPPEFVNSYAVFAGAKSGENYLEEEGLNVKTGVKPDSQIDWLGDANRQQINLCNILDQALTDRRNPGPMEAVSAYFDYLVDMSSARAFVSEFKNELKFFKENPFSVNGVTLDGQIRSHTSLNYNDNELGGYENIKNYFDDLSLLCNNQEIVNQIAPIREILPSGVLLVGPGGTGKTAQAKRFINNADLPFEKISVSSIVNKYFGDSELRLRKYYIDLHKEAEQTDSPIAVLFIDEIEGLVPQRGDNSEGGAGLRIVNTFNDCTGRESDYSRVMVVGATNYAKIADSAVTRSGRLGEILFMPAPNREDLTSIVSSVVKQFSSAVRIDPRRVTDRVNNEKYAPNLLVNSTPPNFDGIVPATSQEILRLAIRKNMLSYLKTGEPYVPVTTEDYIHNLLDYAAARGVKI